MTELVSEENAAWFLKIRRADLHDEVQKADVAEADLIFSNVLDF